jgi:hypothetical protein
MPLIRILACLTVMGALVASVSTRADDEGVYRSDRHGDWGVFRDGQGADLLCWVASEAKLGAIPLDDAGRGMPPGKVLVLYTVQNGELSLELRGMEGPAAGGALHVGGRIFPLLFQDGWGWLADLGDAPAVRPIFEVQESAFLKLGESGYALSLDGFGPALRAAERACE